MRLSLSLSPIPIRLVLLKAFVTLGPVDIHRVESSDLSRHFSKYTIWKTVTHVMPILHFIKESSSASVTSMIIEK